MFPASFAPIIRSVQNCSCSLWYRSYYRGRKIPQAWLINPYFVTFGELCLTIYIIIYCAAMENIKFTCTCFSLNSLCKRTDFTSEPKHFAFPEEPRTFKALLLSLELSAHQEICTRWTENSNGSNWNQKVPEHLVWKYMCFVRWELKEINNYSMRKKT